VVGVVEPAGITMVGVTVTFDGSLLVSVIVTALPAAEGPTLTGNVVVWPSTTAVAAVGKVMLPAMTEVIFCELET
jgi:hypothetical protein